MTQTAHIENAIAECGTQVVNLFPEGHCLRLRLGCLALLRLCTWAPGAVDGGVVGDP